MSFIQLGSLTIAYDDVGNGVPILLVHGTPFNRSMWQDQQRGLSTSYRIITPDLRGYGESTVIPGKTYLDDFARDLAQFLDALEVDQVVLGGLSMGGQIVLEFYRQFPQRVKALILADTFAQLDGEQKKQERYQTADRLVREGMQPYADEVLSKMVCKFTLDNRKPAAEHVITMMRTAHPEGAAAALRGRAERIDYTSTLAEIKVPTLIVVGREDVFTPIADAEYMHQRIANSQLVIFDQAGHMPNMECPDEFNRVVLDFLKSSSIA